MDKPTSTASDVFPMIDIGAQNFAGRLSGRCAAMSVTYLTRMAETGHELVSDDVEILIPGDQAAFHVTYQTVDGRRHRAFVRAPLISVIPANQPHAVYCQRQSDMVVIALDQRLFKERARKALGSDALELIERYAALDPFIRELGNMLRSEFLMRNIPSAAYLESLAGVMAVHVARNYGGKGAAMQRYVGLAPHKLNEAQAFVRAHLADSIRVEQLADAVHMSSYHFARMFKKATGLSPHVYIVTQRIERAKALLRNSKLPLTDVAASVGFQTQGHFTGVFHRYAGLTPRIFRLNCQAAVVDDRRYI